MRFYYYDKDNKKEIKKIDRDNIASDICNKLKTWSQDVEEVKHDYDRIIKEVYPCSNRNQQKIKLIPDVYEQFNTYKANIFKSTYQNYDGMFDIEGLDERSHNVSAILKSSMVYDFYKIHLQGTMDAILDDWITKGECAWFLHWDTKVEKKRIQDFDINEFGEEVAINRMVDEVVHSGADVKRVDPLNVFFDKSQRYNWNMCGKILRDFIPIQYILANKKYKLTPIERSELKELISQSTNKEIDNIKADKLDVGTKVIGNTVEVLEYYGDYIIPDKGDIARNVVITIIAGKYVAQLEESMYPMCPLGYKAYLERPDTLRGQSPLKPTLLLNELENRCMDLQMEAWHMTVNPPFLTPKGMINTGSKLQAGKPFEYNAKVFDDVPPPKPLDMSAGMRGFEFQDFFKRKMEGATGISPYMQGTGGQGGVRTASESTYIYSGQTTRLSREAYLFSHGVIIPIVCGFYKLKREYEEGNSYVPTKREGTTEFIAINDEIRRGEYVFMVGDAQTAVEREQYVKKIMEFMGTPAIQAIVAKPEFPALEFFKWVLNEVNFRQINTLISSITMTDAIANQGRQMGVQPENMGGFVNDMKGAMIQNVPEFANMLANQQAQGEIPSPEQTTQDMQSQLLQQKGF